VMDGYAATRAIRQWERAQGRAAVPIVALTAYARPEDARRSLEAGFTTHLVKPVRKGQLTQTIATLAAPRDPAAGAIGAGPVTPISIRVDRELAAVIPEFLANRRQDVTSLRDALARGDFETVWRLGHRMRGSGAGYGFEAITRIGECLEETARARRPEEAQRWTEELAAYLARVEIVSE
jgi:HPt (histidine-containing phosphotransfer) domain-containing protein